MELFGKERSLDDQRSDRPVSASQSQSQSQCVETRYLLSQSPSQSNTPVMRRERQRNPDHQRALSASSLAASVGLPCPFSPPGTSPTTSLDWQASERLSQANLDAIAFPTLLQTATPRNMSPEVQVHPEVRRSPTAHLQHGMAQGQNQGLQTRTRQGSSDTSPSEETLKDFPREKDGPCPQASANNPKTTPPPILPKASPPAPPSKTSHRPHTLFSLRISESTLQETSALQVAPPLAPPTISLQDYGEVFLQEPAPPSPPPRPPIRETDITEDFPPPPPPLLPPSSPPDGEEEEERRENHHRPGLQHLNSCEFPSLPSSSRQTVPPSIHLSGSPGPSLTPEPQPETPTHQTPISSLPEPQQGPSGEESLGLEYHLLARRERSAGELRVEALARQLVSRGDKTLTPVLDSWAEGGQTMDLMEEIFPAGGGRLLWQRRRISTCLEDRWSYSRPWTLSIASLREEKEVLAEEQRRFRALGGHMESLVQERCKPNEREKYRMFIGDLDKIVNLLLSLCGGWPGVITLSLPWIEREEQKTPEERESLQQKRSQLCSQHEDARELKENLDRRERVVLDILGGYLTGPQLRDYQHYVCMRPALLIRQRHLDELLKQWDEQLSRLAESISPGESDHQGPPGDHQAQPSSSIPGLRGPGPNLGPTHAVRSTTVTSL
ncbi:unnamed protein product [Coregonus sp. 'balchen']|nr:unnamed protein product [Coregonus sp. 'balchen']